ncbi:MAG: DUF6879 family protein [Actinomycetota bacterium]
MGRLFSTFATSAFRLETLARYSVPEEADRLRLFMEGAPNPGPDEGQRAWQSIVRRHAHAGRYMQRVHLIRGPLTDYLRFEIEWGYRDNAAAGEDIRILHVGPDELPELGSEDFWLFDDALAIRMRYDDDGHWTGADTAESSLLAEYQRRRDQALALAVPLSDYLSEVRSP